LKKLKVFFFALIFIILFVSNPVLAHEDEEPIDVEDSTWLGHGILGLVNVVLGISVFLSARSIKKNSRYNAYNIHQKLTVVLALLVTVTFFYGLWVTSQHHEILQSYHGYVGLITSIVAWIAIISSPCVKLIKIPRLHPNLGRILLILLIIQLLLGLQNVFL
jgi:hypothetical protein